MFDKTIISKKIYERRNICGISITELADKMGVSYDVVSNWEKGVDMPDIIYLEPLADILGVTIDYIIRDNCYPNDDGSVTNNNMQDNCPEDLLFIPAQNAYKSGNIPMFCALLESFNAATLSRMFEIAYKDGNIQMVAVMIDYISQTDLYNCAVYAYEKNNIAMFATVIEELNDKNIMALTNMAITDNRQEIIAMLMS